MVGFLMVRDTGVAFGTGAFSVGSRKCAHSRMGRLGGHAAARVGEGANVSRS